MNVIPIFSVGIGKVSEPTYLDLARKIFKENDEMLVGVNGCRTNFKHHNMNKHIIDENYANPADVEMLKNAILRNGIDYLKQTTTYIDIYKYEVFNIWMNEMYSDSKQLIHNHAGFVISGCYYVDVPEHSAPISFYNPDPKFLPPAYEVREKNQYCSEVCNFIPKEGDMFFWFSMLHHSVEPKNYSKPRRSIAFDISVNGLKEKL